MIRVIITAKRKAGMSMEAFKHYYENHHSVRGTRNFPGMARYTRKYLTPVGTDEEPPFDVITETCFETEEDYQRALAHFGSDPAIAEAHFADEENLFDRSTILTFLVDECRTDL